MLNPKGEKLVSRLLLGGCGLTLVAGVLLAMVLAQGIGQLASSNGKDAGGIVMASMVFLAVLAGIGMMIAGLVMGLKLSVGKEDRSDRHLPDVTIASRFALTEHGEMIFSNFEYDAPGGKLYVQIRFPDGHIEEMRTAWAVFCQCGEGMRGAALVRGSWLSSFAPIIARAEPSQNPEL